jgi:hypothetical protein
MGAPKEATHIVIYEDQKGSFGIKWKVAFKKHAQTPFTISLIISESETILKAPFLGSFAPDVLVLTEHDC